MKRIVLASYPQGTPKESDFRIEDAPAPALTSGGLLVRTTWLSVDPYMRGLMNGRDSYFKAFHAGDVIVSGAVGEVIESDAPGFSPGDFVNGMWGWQETAAVETGGVRKLDPSMAPVETALGILGMPGMTAYFGLIEICHPKAGETVFVSGAAGAVGSAVGQIAKILGCRVVGSAGSVQKCEYLRTLGFDAVHNYKTDKPHGAALEQLCPEGIDCYFDNVGGELTDAVLRRMNLFGRVSVCGQISQYNNMERDLGPRPFWILITKQLRVEGFLVSRWLDRWPEGIRQMASWMREGRLRYDETIYEGLESTPRAFIGLFTGENTGKALVRL